MNTYGLYFYVSGSRIAASWNIDAKDIDHLRKRIIKDHYLNEYDGVMVSDNRGERIGTMSIKEFRGKVPDNVGRMYFAWNSYGSGQTYNVNPKTGKITDLKRHFSAMSRRRD